MKNPIAKRK